MDDGYLPAADLDPRKHTTGLYLLRRLGNWPFRTRYYIAPRWQEEEIDPAFAKRKPDPRGYTKRQAQLQICSAPRHMGTRKGGPIANLQYPHQP